MPRDFFLAGLSRKDLRDWLLYVIITATLVIITIKIIKLLAVLPYCCKTREKMLVFDRPSSSLLPWYFSAQSTIQPPLPL